MTLRVVTLPWFVVQLEPAHHRGAFPFDCTTLFG